MPFVKGKAPGRPKGAKNLRTRAAQEILRELNFEPLVEMVENYRAAKKIFNSYGVIYDALEDARIEEGKKIMPTEDKADKYLKIASDIAADIAGFVHPKLKSIEHQIKSPVEDMSVQEQIEAHEMAAESLKNELKK